MNNSINKPIIVAVSGGFDPIHVGHVRMFNEARKLGDKLVVILNNDHWLRKKKGYVFMPEAERKEVIEGLKAVDGVVLTGHGENPQDMSVCAELRQIKPNIFANGGDRKLDNIPEVAVCHEIGCQMVFNVGTGGKMQSSSWLLENFYKNGPFPKVGVGVMVFKNNKILLGKRLGSHGSFNYAWPGGHLEHLESFEKCAKREVMEEAGIEIDNIRFLRLMNLKEYAPKHYVDICLAADWKGGEPQALEPNKCEGWNWYDLDALPQPLFAAEPSAIEAHQTGKYYFDF